MYFKSIEIAGFKSFVDHTKITFDPGVTGIVGPNGCGKSNISDAIRWVLGEMRPKLLRGTKMEDFLFNGSSGRKPTGMAEVSITVSSVGGMAKRPELAEFDEITVTRRLHRDGESEYLINKAPCRLKDVIDLFLDTGISTRAFSIIEQDQVQRIVTSKPEERRFIIEEAAGIMKYKHRRQEALNKLENSNDNLARVSDIIGELEKQRNSLKRQANKAERYKSFKAEMGGLLLAVSADDYRGLKASSAMLEAEVARLEEVRVSMEAGIASRNNERAGLQNAVNEAGEEMSRLKDEEYRLGGSIERDQGRLNLCSAQMQELAKAAERLSAEMDVINRSLDGLRAEAASKGEAAGRITAMVEQKTADLAKKRAELSSVQSEIDSLTTEISTSERELAVTVGSAANTGAMLAGHKSRMEMILHRLERINVETSEARNALDEAQRLKDERMAELSRVETGLGVLRSKHSELGGRREGLARSRREKENEINALKTSLTQVLARLDSLKEIEGAREGYQDGVKSLLKLKDGGNDAAGRLKGALVDRIKADSSVEKALEAALGEKVQALLVDDPMDAVSAVNLLKKDGLGRGTFVSMRVGSDAGLHPSWSGMVRMDDEVRRLVQSLLAGVAFVNNIEAAVRMYSETGLACVTADGDFVDARGVISGGSPNATGGILERKRLMGELSAQADSTTAKLEVESSALAQIISEDGAAEAEQAEAARAMKDEELRIVHERKDVESVEAEARRQAARLETYRVEADSIGLERESMESEIAGLAAQLEEFNRQKAELEAEVRSSRERQERSRENLKTVGEIAASAEVELAGMKGELIMIQADKARVESQIANSASRTESIRNELASGVRRQGELEAETAGLKDAIHSALEKRSETAGLIRGVSEKIEGMRAELGKMEDDLRNASAALDGARESLGEARIRLSETAVRLESLLERVAENGHSIEELETYDLSQSNVEESKQRLAEVRENITKIGDVNLEAIEDYRQVEERLTFLTAQRDDLNKSIEDIKKVIDKINHTTKDLFDETFVMVRQNFREIFAKLFNGGEADMVLVDEANSLDSGIEIIARPPGKRRQSLTLMSAGEKSMTAVAVLFSVFRVKPSPFCLLDEVDAPLDDANIGRFREMLNEFTSGTQFLVITHNQKTMAFAERLYGITMQEPGVSSVLSVDLVDTDDSSRQRLQVVHG